MRLDERTVDRLFGGYVRTHRNYQNMMISVAARAAGISAYRWAALERGQVQKGVTAKECSAIAKVLGLEIEEILRMAAYGRTQEEDILDRGARDSLNAITRSISLGELPNG